MKNIHNLFIFVFLIVLMGSCRTLNEEAGEFYPSPIISIGDVRKIYQGEEVKLDRGTNLVGAEYLVGVVISDPDGRNLPEGTITLQNYKRNVIRGINLHIGSEADKFLPGDSVVVNIDGSSIRKFDGILQLTNISSGAITRVSTNNPLTETFTTLGDIAQNPDKFESTLVYVNSVSFRNKPATGELYEGNKDIVDGMGVAMLVTKSTAEFADVEMPETANYVAIPYRYIVDGEERLTLWPRNKDDLQDPSGRIYDGFPETFDAHPTSFKPDYNMNTPEVPNNVVTFTTGPWSLTNIRLGDANNDRVLSAPNAVRFQQNLTVPVYLEMQFDVMKGASKVGLWVSSYGDANDKPAEWALEYSKNMGRTWTQIGNTYWAVSKVKQYISIPMDITGRVRFRVHKIGNGSGANNVNINNGRLSIDNFAVFENPKTGEDEDDEKYTPGALYSGFPEEFITDVVKDAYATGVVTFNSGGYTLNQTTIASWTSSRNGITNSPASTPPNRGLQMNQNAVAIFEMNYDLPYGASKVTVDYGRYGTDAIPTWRLEYKTASSSDWIPATPTSIGDGTIPTAPEILASVNAQRKAVFENLGITEPVRFRIYKVLSPSGNNGRLNFDNFAIYQ